MRYRIWRSPTFVAGRICTTSSCTRTRRKLPQSTSPAGALSTLQIINRGIVRERIIRRRVSSRRKGEADSMSPWSPEKHQPVKVIIKTAQTQHYKTGNNPLHRPSMTAWSRRLLWKRMKMKRRIWVGWRRSSRGRRRTSTATSTLRAAPITWAASWKSSGRRRRFAWMRMRRGFSF